MEMIPNLEIRDLRGAHIHGICCAHVCLGRIMSLSGQHPKSEICRARRHCWCQFTNYISAPRHEIPEMINPALPFRFCG